jgi:hypothetical protein
MKPLQSITFLLFLTILCLIFSCQKEVVDSCNCESQEVCIYNECYLSETVHYLGGTRFIAPNSYVGIVSNNQCIDTLVFYIDTTRAVNDNRFGLIVAHYIDGIQNVAGSYPTVVSEKEYFLGTAAELCYLNGEAWYANLHFVIEQERVWMKMRFYTLASEPNTYIDSCEVNFYKKE